MNRGSLAAAVTALTIVALSVPVLSAPDLAAPAGAAVKARPGGLSYAVAAQVLPAVASQLGEVVALTNARRAAVGAPPVTWNACLVPYSQTWAQTLAARGSLAHQDLGPLLSACSLASTGENVAMGYATPSAVVTGWMNSPSHRANILNPVFTQISIGLATDGSGRRYWTMNLGAGSATAPNPPTGTPGSAPTPRPAPRPTPDRARRPVTKDAPVRLTPVA